QGAAELLMSGLVLRGAKFGLTQGAFERGEQVGNRLGVVPDVGAGAMAAPRIIATTLPGPELAIGLAQDCGRFQDRKVGRNRLNDLWRQCGVIKAIAEPRRLLPEFVIMVAPIKANAVDIGEPAGIPRTEVLLWLRFGGRARILADAQVG